MLGPRCLAVDVDNYCGCQGAGCDEARVAQDETSVLKDLLRQANFWLRHDYQLCEERKPSNMCAFQNPGHQQSNVAQCNLP